MRRHALTCAAALALAATLQAAAPAVAVPTLQRGGYHEDPRCGYKIKPPKDWEQIPLKLDETWHVAKFLSRREYFWTDPDSGWTRDHKPRLTVIAFVERSADEEESAEGKDGDDETTVALANPYADYKDYLKRTYSGGGYHISAEDEGMVANVRTTQLEIKVERGSYDGPKRIVTWIYHLEGLDLAIEFEVLETAWDKLKKTVLKTLKSFKPIPRTGGELPGNEGLSARLMTLSEMDDLSPADRRKQREELEKSLHDKARESLPEGWTAEEMGHFLVLNHCDDKVAERMVERADAVLLYLEDRFHYVGREEYVRRPILRICKSREEENSYRKGGQGWFSLNDLEVVTHNDNMGTVGSYEGEWLNRRVVDLWFNDRDRDLYWAFPAWLRQGFQNSFANALPKRKKLEFRKDDWDRDELRERVRNGTATPPRELILMGRSKFYGSGSGYWDRQREAGALARFFLSGDADKSSKTRDVLDDYIMNLVLVVQGLEEEEDDDDPEKKPKTEKEEDEYFRKRREAWKEKERMILDDVFDRTFRSWTEKDWAAFEKVYFKSIK